MNLNRQILFRRERYNQGGQALPLVAATIFLLFAFAALAIDMGNYYYSYQELKSATQAAALAGGAAIISKTQDAVSTAYQYSGDPNQQAIYNLHPNLNYTAGSTVAKMGCIDTIAHPGYGLPPCATYGVNTGNAIQVTESATVNTYFARIFGINTLPLSATATAGATGGAAGSWNVNIILDTTPSMSIYRDTNCGLGFNATRLQCALDGIQVLLTTLSPCPAGSTCTTSNATDRVALFTFPNVSVSGANDDTCGGGSPTALPTSFPTANGTSYNPTGSTTATYQILGYANDYQGSNPANPPALSTNSLLAQAAGGVKNCAGIQAPTSGWPGSAAYNGGITYYAGVIYAAQASLVAEQAAYPASQNAMVLLSDGDAENSQTFMATGATNSGTYPSWVDQCGQAVAAAQAAMTAGTRIYSVAYGSASTGCLTDVKSSSNPTGTGITPCQTMEAIAGGHTSTYFYSDYNQSGSPSTCQSASQHVTSLHDIFLSIGESLRRARLVPNTLWPSS